MSNNNTPANRSPTCYCPVKVTNTKKKSQRKKIKKISQSLLSENECKCGSKERINMTKKAKQLKQKMKTEIYNNILTPSLKTRRLIRGEHCKFEDTEFPTFPRKSSKSFYRDILWSDTDSESEDDPHTIKPGYNINDAKQNEKRNMKISYTSVKDTKCLMRMASNPSLVQHTFSDQSIVRVASPALSGEVMDAKLASPTPSHCMPLPPTQDDLSVRRPRSGLYINVSEGNIPKELMADYEDEEYYVPQQETTYSRKRREVKPICLCPLRHSQKRRKWNRRSKIERRRNKQSARNRFQDTTCICMSDLPPKQPRITIPKNIVRKTLESYSMTTVKCPGKSVSSVPFGILSGSYNMFNSTFDPAAQGQQALCMSVMAYGLTYLLHPKQWTAEQIDNILETGNIWYLQLKDKLHDHSAVEGLCEVLQFDKKEIMTLNGKRMQVLLEEPQVIGYTKSLDTRTYNLCRGLEAFFAINRAAILLTRDFKCIIWKEKVCFYIFDPAGRDSRGYADREKGNAILLTLRNMKAVIEMLIRRGAGADAVAEGLADLKFALCPVRVLQMADEDCPAAIVSDDELTTSEKAMADYRMLSDNLAIVSASLHLEDERFAKSKNRQALAIAIVAMTYAKVSPPNTWQKKTLDKIMRLGNQFYKDCSYVGALPDLSIDNVPTDFALGPYCCEIIIFRDRVKGQLFTTDEDVLNINRGLEEFFNKEYNSGILQFGIYTLAFWQQRSMFYLFDPHPRSAEGVRALRGAGAACVLMNLDVETLASMLEKNWKYLLPGTQFTIHAFKVLKLKIRAKKEITCSMSDEDVCNATSGPCGGPQSQSQPQPSWAGGARKAAAVPVVTDENKTNICCHENKVDEQPLGEISSLLDSIHEDYIPKIPVDCFPEIEEIKEKIINLDSPSVSATQILCPWPEPREGVQPEPDPDPEPEPEMQAEGEGGPSGMGEESDQGEQEEEGGGENEDAKKDMKLVKEDELQTQPPTPPELQPAPTPVEVGPVESPAPEPRKVLLAADARHRSKLRAAIRRPRRPCAPPPPPPPDSDDDSPTNFRAMPDGSHLVLGSSAVDYEDADNVLPFVSIVAIVTSYKYTIVSWTSGIVDFVIETAQELYANKLTTIQVAPKHFFPKIAIGSQCFQITVDVICDGASWQLERKLNRVFKKRDRVMITTCQYSCAAFMRRGQFYMFSGAPNDAVGLRAAEGAGTAAFVRFDSLHALVHRFLYNKNGEAYNQQFILSMVDVRHLSESNKTSEAKIANKSKQHKRQEYIGTDANKRSHTNLPIGYQLIDNMYRIEGTAALDNREEERDIKQCHFVCVFAMLMIIIHPVPTWNSHSIDIALEKGIEIYHSLPHVKLCDRRAVKNILMENKLFDLIVKKIVIVNENNIRRLDQFVNAVLENLRYVIITFPQCSMIIHQSGGLFHVFDCYPSPKPDVNNPEEETAETGEAAASWTLFRTTEQLIRWLKFIIPASNINNPSFYTFEVTSVREADKKAIFNYKLSLSYEAKSENEQPRYKHKVFKCVDEQLSWLDTRAVPWSRCNPYNDIGNERKTPAALWKDWDIEYVDDLYSLWGNVHPMSQRFDESSRGRQVLAVNTVAIAMTYYYKLSEWNSNIIDATVIHGNEYHENSVADIATPMYELGVNDIASEFTIYPYTFTVVFEHVVYGSIYNLKKEQYNLKRALTYFFDSNDCGLIMCNNVSIAFGKTDSSYFMFDAQSFGMPLFAPGQGVAYILKCETLNRLIHCLTLTLSIRKHGIQFDIYNVAIQIMD